MKKTLTFSFFLASSYLANLVACDCIFIPTFCEHVTYENNGQVLSYISIHRIRVTAKHPTGLEIFISQTYAGENLVGHEQFIKDGNGADCVLFSSNLLELDKEYIIAASNYDDTLTLSDCAVSFLKIENGMVVGSIAPGVSSVALELFPSTVGCGNLTPTFEPDPTVIGGLVVRPTLVEGEVDILTKSVFNHDDLRVSVYDVAGRLVHSQLMPDFGFYSRAKVDMSQWSGGTYFISVEAGGEKKVVKVVNY